MTQLLTLFVFSLTAFCSSKSFIINNKDNNTSENVTESINDFVNRNGNYFLWEIQGSSPSYLFGTIHVPYNMVWDSIPKNMMQAFNNSQEIYLELNMNEDTLSKLNDCEKLPNGQNVADVLPKNLYLKWKSYIKHLHTKVSSWISPTQKSHGLTADTIFYWLFEYWTTRRPIWTLLKAQMVIESYIKSIEYLQLDSYLAELGRQSGKLVDGIEHVEETCSIINNLNDSQVLFILNKTMELDHEVLTTVSSRDLNNLIHRYRNGDISPAYFSQKFGFFPQIGNNKNGNNNESISINSEEERKMAIDIHTYLRDRIIFERNEIMARRIMKLIEDDPSTSYFFAFGVGHFIGKDSVVDILRKRNISVERIPPETYIETNSSKFGKSYESCDCDKQNLFPWFICTIKCIFGL